MPRGSRSDVARPLADVDLKLLSANDEAFNVELVKISALAIMSALTAVAGLPISPQIGSRHGSTATGMELDVIAAMILGGTSLFGGNGRITVSHSAAICPPMKTGAGSAFLMRTFATGLRMSRLLRNHSA